MSELPAGERENAGQSVQASAGPLDALKVPAVQIVHVSPSAPLAPALQEQFVMYALFAGESEFSGQSVQNAAISFE